jgi:hypothetical protein
MHNNCSEPVARIPARIRCHWIESAACTRQFWYCYARSNSLPDTVEAPEAHGMKIPSLTEIDVITRFRVGQPYKPSWNQQFSTAFCMFAIVFGKALGRVHESSGKNATGEIPQLALNLADVEVPKMGGTRVALLQCVAVRIPGTKPGGSATRMMSYNCIVSSGCAVPLPGMWTRVPWDTWLSGTRVPGSSGAEVPEMYISVQ